MPPNVWLSCLMMYACVWSLPLWASTATDETAMDRFVAVYDQTLEVLDAIEAIGESRTYQWEEQRRLLLPLVDELVLAWEELLAEGVTGEDAAVILAQVLSARQVQAVTLLELEQCASAVDALDALNAHPALATGEYGYVRAAVERRRLEATQCIQLQQSVELAETALQQGCQPGLSLLSIPSGFDAAAYPLLDVQLRAMSEQIAACEDQLEWTRDPGRRRAGWTLCGLGAVLLVSGATAGALASTSEDDAARIAAGGGTLDEYNDARSEGRRRATMGTALLLSGGALASGGLVMALTAPRRQMLRDSAAEPSPRPPANVALSVGRMPTVRVSW